MFGNPRQALLEAILAKSRRPSMGFAPENSGSHRTPRWRRQSRANPSLNQIPCYAGKIQGISSIFSLGRPDSGRNDHNNQCLTSKFPTQRNRELIGPYQGIKSAYQGIKSTYQGSFEVLKFSARVREEVRWLGFSGRSKASSLYVGYKHTPLARRSATAMEIVLA
jgi:hypothetical protein